MVTETKALKLKGQTAVFIDYANVYGWNKSLKRPISPKKLFQYLKKYSEIKLINFYYGTDNHPKSKKFLQDIKKIGYRLTTKPVKHITLSLGHKIRKCDFDIEICMAVYACLDKNYSSFIFFSGDGDFAPLYQYLIEHHKQVIVVYCAGHIDRGIWSIKRGLFKIQIDQLPL